MKVAGKTEGNGNRTRGEDFSNSQLPNHNNGKSLKIINARITYRTSPIHHLEKFAFKDLSSAYSSLLEYSGLKECVILQTCNRVEIFGSSPADSDKFDVVDRIKKTWASVAGLGRESFNGNLEISENDKAYEHLLKLTSGLDSMVVGEEQILGQIKGSISEAKKAKAAGKSLNTLFDKAIRVGNQVRNSTGISKGSVSLGSMAVKIAEENIDDLKSKNILLIGTGEAASLVAKSLNKRGVDFCVTSRTYQRARSFSETVGGKPVRFEEVMEDFNGADVLFVATVAPYYLVTYDRIKKSLAKRGTQTQGKGIMILDMSNPRAVEEKVSFIGNIKMFNLDQIGEMVDKNMKSRMGMVSSAEKIIDQEMPVLNAMMKRLEIEPVIGNVFKDTDLVRERELKKAIQLLGEQDPQRIRIIEQLSHAIVEGIISGPMNNLRKAYEHGDTQLAKAVSRLFDYDINDNDYSDSKNRS